MVKWKKLATKRKLCTKQNLKVINWKDMTTLNVSDLFLNNLLRFSMKCHKKINSLTEWYNLPHALEHVGWFRKNFSGEFLHKCLIPYYTYTTGEQFY